MYTIILTIIFSTPNGMFINSMNSVSVGSYKTLADCIMEKNNQVGKNNVYSAFCVKAN